MSLKIIKQIINYAQSEEICNLSITEEYQHLSIKYHLPNSRIESFNVRHSERGFFSDYLRQLLSIPPGELATNICFPITSVKWLKHWRASILPHKNHEKVILHLPQTTKQKLHLSALGLSPADLKKFRQLNKIHSGLIIVSSPSGKGRSTTLQTIIDTLNPQDSNIYFIGQNINEPTPGINYLVPRNDNWDKLMHHDSDIIITDDFQTPNDLNQAVIAANSGRLVIISLVAASCLDALNILVDNVSPALLKSIRLKFISNQHLTTRHHTGQLSSRGNNGHVGIFETLTWSTALNQSLTNLFSQTKTNHELKKGLTDIISKAEFSSLDTNYNLKLNRKIL